MILQYSSPQNPTIFGLEASDPTGVWKFFEKFNNDRLKSIVNSRSIWYQQFYQQLINHPTRGKGKSSTQKCLAKGYGIVPRRVTISQINLGWFVPLPSKSHHQDCWVFSSHWNHGRGGTTQISVNFCYQQIDFLPIGNFRRRRSGCEDHFSSWSQR